MATFEEEFKARMTLMEGKELRFGTNIPGTNKRELVLKAIESLEGYLKSMETRPEDYVEEDTNPKFTISVELLKINKEPNWKKGLTD